jgi:class 3 adenylate cyclase
VLVCARCGSDNHETARFCSACGAALARPHHAGEERRVVSIVFVDLVGFTSRSERLDPEDVREILAPYYGRVRRELERFGGHVEKFIGDAVLGVFGAPVAHGDDHERAVRAALAVRDWAGEDNVEVRIAVNTGEALVDMYSEIAQGEALIAGDVVNTAARLQSAAPVGGVLVGAETYASTRATIEYQPAAPVAAKGKADPVHAWLAIRPTTPAGERPLTPVPLVGRTRELELLKRMWAEVSEQRRPQLVTVFGPAGIGKSRVAKELVEHVAAGDGRVLRGRSAPYGARSSYGAFGQHVKRLARIFDNDDVDEARAKLDATVANLVGTAEADTHARHLAMLVGLGVDDDGADRRALFASARAVVESLASREPTLLLFEDIHWSDASLLDLIETLAASVSEVPLLLVALARPELLATRPDWGGNVPAYTAVSLEPLSSGAATELAERHLERAEATSALAGAVARAGDGNPLFIEELAASLAERSTLDARHLPTNVRAIISARLDRLPPEERNVLVDASVVGRVFWRGALSRMSPNDGLSTILDSLEARDLVRREAVSRIRGEQQFAFKHAVIRDVAYQRLPRAARRKRHAAVADFLEQTTGESGQSLEAVAYHAEAAADDERAVRYLVAAADQAGRGWAKEHALALYAQALRLVPEDDRTHRRSIMLRQAVTAQALQHIIQADVPTPGTGV